MTRHFSTKETWKSVWQYILPFKEFLMYYVLNESGKMDSSQLTCVNYDETITPIRNIEVGLETHFADQEAFLTHS